jgi:integrase
MSVRKRQWTTGKGVAKEAWVVDYVDRAGKRRLKTFPRKKEADAYSATARVEVREGTHVADRDSATVGQAGALWLARATAEGLERATIDSYRQHLAYHIEPFIGSSRLSRVSAPTLRAFEDRLREEGRSPSMVRRVMRTMGSILADAQDRGLIVHNAARDLRARRKGKDRKSEKRQKGKLKIGVDIPTPAEIRSIIEHAEGRWRPLLLTAIFTGLRVSELRGLRWADVDLKGRVLHVRQRADRYNQIGRPKSEAGERTIPLPRIVADALGEWRKDCPKSDLGLAFPTGTRKGKSGKDKGGNIEGLGNIVNRGLKPTQLAAGVTVPILDAAGKPKLDAEGNPMVRAKYTGMHALRHFFASWCINRRADGGLELPPKVAQERLGHASIVMTMDVYGHLFPRGDDLAELDAAELVLLSGEAKRG